MKHFFLSILLIFPVGLSAQDLVEFENGKVADADDINSNFNLLKEKIEAMPTDTSCAIEKSPDTVTISCPNESAVVLDYDPNVGTCVETDFVGVWLFTGPDDDNSAVADLEFWGMYSDGRLLFGTYEYSFSSQFSEGTEAEGTWGNFSSAACRVEIAGSVGGADYRGYAFLSKSKSALNGFLCSATSCAAGALNKISD